MFSKSSIVSLFEAFNRYLAIYRVYFIGARSVTKDEYKNIYHDLPDNSESGFRQLLDNNYDMIAKGFGILNDNQFEDIPVEVWEMDCKWKLKRKE